MNRTRRTPSRTSRPHPVRALRRRAFSVIEMLVALTISAMLLTATLTALDACFKSYKVTTESASTHVVGRLVMQRMLTLIRTGEEFGPYPANPVITPTIESTSIEFAVPVTSTLTQVWTVERIDSPDPETGPFHLQATLTEVENGVAISTTTRTMLRNVQDVLFILDYDVGPRLRRATIDITIQPDDDQADTIGAPLDAPVVRMVASTSPRRLEE